MPGMEQKTLAWLRELVAPYRPREDRTSDQLIAQRRRAARREAQGTCRDAQPLAIPLPVELRMSQQGAGDLISQGAGIRPHAPGTAVQIHAAPSAVAAA